MTTTQTKLYQRIATHLSAYQRCVKECDRAQNDNARDHWQARADDHKFDIDALVTEYLPSGGGIDSGTQIDLSRSTAERIVLIVSYHHMNDAGIYNGWTNHDVVVTPSLMYGFAVRVTGRDKNGVKEYLAEIYHENLGAEIAPHTAQDAAQPMRRTGS